MHRHIKSAIAGIALGVWFAATPMAQVVADAGGPAGDDKSALTPSRMLQILAADVAVQRGEYEVAATIYLELATSLKDARLARRAAQAGTLARKPDLVLEAAKVWASLEPD